MHEPMATRHARVEHDLATRILMGGLGLLVTLGCLAITVALVGASFMSERMRVTVLLLAFAAPFGLGCIYGGALLRRAFRGWSHVSERSLRHDREMRDPRTVRGLAYGVVSATGMFLLTGGKPWAFAGSFGLETLVWYVFILPMWLLPTVLLHELGHASAALLAGLPVSVLRFGPFEVTRLQGRVRIGLHRGGLGAALGLTQLDPARALSTPGRYLTVVLGGPLMDIVMCLLLAAVARACGADTPAAARGATALLWVGSAASGLSALTNLVPLRLESGLLSDGAQIAMLLQLRRSPGISLLFAVGQESGTKRPRDWSIPLDDLLHVAQSGAEKPDVRGNLLLFALAIALDRGDLTAAGNILERVAPELHALRAPLRMELRLQDAMFHALHFGDVERARQAWREAGPYALSPFYPRLAEAAVLTAEGRQEEAAQALAEWEHEAERSGRRAQLETGNQWALELLRKRAAA